MTSNPAKYNVRGREPAPSEYKEIQMRTYNSMAECVLAGGKLGKNITILIFIIAICVNLCKQK